jgi:hypothetical protein
MASPPADSPTCLFPDFSARSPARLVFSIAVVITLAGALVTVLRSGGSGWNAWLFLDHGLSHRAASQTELALVVVTLCFSLAGLFLRRWRWGTCLMIPAFAFLLTESCLIAKMGGVGHAEWAPAAHALRYGTPLALALLAMKEPFGEAQVVMLLRVSLAFVFVTHGAEALMHYPRFIDLIIGTGENLLGWRVTESQAKSILTVIGWVDVITGVAILIRPLPALLWWMAIWGLVTALSRMTSLGWDAYRDVLMRVTHFVVPFVLVWFRRRI